MSKSQASGFFSSSYFSLKFFIYRQATSTIAPRSGMEGTNDGLSVAWTLVFSKKKFIYLPIQQSWTILSFFNFSIIYLLTHKHQYQSPRVHMDSTQYREFTPLQSLLYIILWHFRSWVWKCYLLLQNIMWYSWCFWFH